MTRRRAANGRTRAISPAVGVALLLVIVAALAGILTVLLLDLGDTQPQVAPRASFDTAYVADGAGNTNDRPYVNITHSVGETADGDRVFVVDSDGNSVAWADVWTADATVDVGDHVHIDGFGSDGALNPACEGETYRLVWRPETGSAQVFNRVEITQEPVGPAASHC